MAARNGIGTDASIPQHIQTIQVGKSAGIVKVCLLFVGYPKIIGKSQEVLTTAALSQRFWGFVGDPNVGINHMS